VTPGDAIRNAYIDFGKTNLSLVAVVTDVIRDGKPVVGQGSMTRERFIPRILETLTMPASHVFHPLATCCYGEALRPSPSLSIASWASISIAATSATVTRRLVARERMCS
jgi:hypothetical protein